ncbi:EF hand [Trypanosoma cruzi]|nr:EF hand [Trypanosoma cruzi]
MSCCRSLNAPDALTCQVCLDSFQNPTQLFICGHIFCEACVQGASTCPTCRGRIEYSKPAPDSVLQAVLLLPVSCGSCGWQGTRKQSQAHRCGIKDTHSIYNKYPHLSDEELYKRATSVTGSSVFHQPSQVHGIMLSSHTPEAQQ